MNSNFADLSEAQRDMRTAYHSGGPGIIASAVVWACAAAVAMFVSPRAAVYVVLAGGMMIHPAAILLCRMLGRTGQHDAGNPLRWLALESTGMLVLAIPIAFLVAYLRIDLFVPAMLLIVGGRYLTFQTLYGMRIYWILGSGLALVTFAVIVLGLRLAHAAALMAVMEAGFGAVILQRSIHPRAPQQPHAARR